MSATKKRLAIIALTCACVGNSWTVAVAQGAIVSRGMSATALTGDLVVPMVQMLDGSEQIRDAAEARRMSPGAFTARETSRTAYANLPGDAAVKVVREVFPQIVNEPLGGPPPLPPGEKITRYTSDNAAQVALPAGRHAVIESLLPIALNTSSTHHAPIDLRLRGTRAGFQPRFPAVAVRVPKRLSTPARIPGVQVSLAPVRADGSPLSVVEGKLDGASVIYPNAASDTDVVLKPTTFGLAEETILRSEASPRRLLYRVGMPSGARLVSAVDGSGDITVVDGGDSLATVAPPVARDSEGTPVPLVARVISKDVLSISISAPVGGYRYPIVVDPTVTDNQWRNEFYYETYYRTEWTFVHEGAAFTAPPHPEGASWTESIAATHGGSEFGGLSYTTRGASQIVASHVEGHWNDTGAHIQNYMILYVPKAPYTEDYDALAVATEEGRESGGYACAPSQNCPGTTVGSAPPENNNTAVYQQSPTGAGGSGSNTVTGAYVTLSQEQKPELSFNSSSSTIYNSQTSEYVPNVLYGGGQWLGPHSGAFEVRAKDPGLGLSLYRVTTFGWGDYKSYYGRGECIGLQCPEQTNQGYTYKTGMPDGEDGFEALAEDPAGLYEDIYPETIKVDATPPHAIKIVGFQNGNELPLGETHVKVEATDGTEPRRSSGVKSIKVTVDGHEVQGSAASCPLGPCAASTEVTLPARDYSSGQHSLVATATDNANNVAQEEFTFRVHGAAPVPVGPGSLDPSTGQFTLSANDVSLGGATGVSRTYRSRELTAGAEGPLGPQWAINVGGGEGLTVSTNGSATLSAAGGADTSFVLNTKGEYEAPKGDSNLKLEAKEKTLGNGISEYLLSDATAGTKTKFEQPSGITSAAPAFAQQFGGEAQELTHPEGTAVDPSGNVWVTDFTGDLVDKFSPSGALLATYGSQGTAGGQFIEPWGVAVDPRSGNGYVTDLANSRIEELSSTGAFIKTFGWGVHDGKSEPEVCTTECKVGIAGAGSGQLNIPTGIAIDATGNVWVVDSANNRIVEFNEKGEYVARFGAPGSGNGQLKEPSSIAVAKGNIYVTDSGNNRVEEFSPGGTYVSQFGTRGSGTTQFNGPRGIAADPMTGNLYISDFHNHRVAEYNPTGKYVTLFGTAGAGPGQFQEASGVAVSASGAIYAADYINGRVGEWTRPTWLPSEAGGALERSSTTYAYNTIEEEGKAVIQPVEVLAPAPAGVPSCTPLVRGCRALTFNYAQSTTATGPRPTEWGDYVGHLTRVYFHAWDPTKGAMTEAVVAQYAYDSTGRLRTEWDPRITPALKTTYGYDTEGHVTALTAPGEQPWALTYGTISGDANTGRLLKVTRPPASTAPQATEAPANSEVPKLSGSAVRGATLGVGHGKWSNNPVAYAYQWLSCEKECLPIAGADNANYTVTEADAGFPLEATVTATNGAGSTSVTTAESEGRKTAPEIAEYPLAANSGPAGVASGSDKNLWIASRNLNKLVKLATSGAILSEYGLASGSLPTGIAPGPDGNLWITEEGSGKILKSTTAGVMSEYALPAGSKPKGITTGPDKNLWVTESGTSKIAKITTSGVVTEYPTPANSRPEAIASGPDGNLWVAAAGTNKILKITPAGSIASEYSLSGPSNPQGIAGGADGNLWFSAPGIASVGRITTSGAITYYPVEQGSNPRSVVAGPDGDLWFTGTGTGRLQSVTTTGIVTEYNLPEAPPEGSKPWGITVGSDGNVWFTDNGTGNIGKANLGSDGERYAPEPGSTIEYGVPITGSAAPHPLLAKDAAEWGQKDDPVEGTAIFPPDEPMGWPATSYKRATISYWDVEGRMVNTALPTGGIATSEYNKTNDVTRTLSADNRATALKEGAKSSEVANLLDTESKYNGETKEELAKEELEVTQARRLAPEPGTELLETRGPQHKVKLAETGREVLARNNLKYFYDEGAPATKHYGLVTKTIDTAEYESKQGDSRTTTTSYSGQNNLGWTLRKATSRTIDPAGLHLTTTSTYDESTGNLLEVTAPAGTSGHWTPVYASKFGAAGSGNGQLHAPKQIAIDKAGDIWIADEDNNRLEVFTEKGDFLRTIGSLGSGNGQFKEPKGLAVDSKGNVWAVDAQNNRIEEFTESGTFEKAVGTAGTGNLQFKEPRAITIDSHNNLWIADDKNNRIEELNEKGEYVTTIGKAGTGNGQLSEPKAAVVDTHGNLWVTDGSNNRIEEFNEKGEFLKTSGSLGSAPGQFKSPKDLTIDSYGNLWVVDGENNRIEELNEKGEYTATFGSTGSGNGQFTNPWGIAVDPHGDLLVSDESNARVETFVNGTSAAHSTRTIYYSSTANQTNPACGERPEWAGLSCQTQPGTQPEDAPNLPVTNFSYNMWDETEKATETIAAITRVKAETYDLAGRALTSETTSSVNTPLPKVTNVYNTQTGALETQSTTAEGKTKTITSVSNSLGQLTSYIDADANTTKYVYDGDGRIEEVSDAQGSQTYAYDPTTGLLTKLVDSGAHTFTASYDAGGQIASETYPNGMTATYARNASGEATGLEYVKTTHCTEKCTWFADSRLPSIHGETLTQTSTLATERYTYDNAARLAQAQEEPGGKSCTTRLYAYDEESNRTSLTTREPGAEGSCAAGGGTVQAHSYDTANRLTDAGVTYDQFGNTTAIPASDSGKYALTSKYYVDNQLESQTENAVTTIHRYDPVGRTDETAALGKTVTAHYDGPGEALTWTGEGGSVWTRDIPGIDGTLSATQASTGATTLQLHDLQGNVAATAALSETETKLLSTYNNTEFGVPQPGTTPLKYSWLGATGLETGVATGVANSGGTSYIPLTGRALQTEPVVPPGAFPDGTATVSVVQASYLPAAASQLKALAVQHEAALEEAARLQAEEEAARNQCPASECGPWPSEDGAEIIDPIHHYRAWQAEEKGEKLLRLVDAGDLVDALGTLFGTLGDYIDGYLEARLTTGFAYKWLEEYGQFLEACVRELHGRNDSHGGCRGQYSDIGPVPDFWIKPVISFCLVGRATSSAIDGLSLSGCTRLAYIDETIPTS